MKIERPILLNELKHLTHLNDMPRRVKMCQAALALVNRNTHPELWADLQFNLGISLRQNPLGDRAKNIEQDTIF